MSIASRYFFLSPLKIYEHSLNRKKKEIAGESLISVIIIRNTLGFAVSYGIDPWINGMGLQNCFITVSMVALVCTFTFLPMIFVGKKLRRFSTKKYWEYVATSAAPAH